MILLYKDRFKKNFARLSPKIQKTFAERMNMYLKNPRHPLLKVHPLRGNLIGLRAFAVSGDVRVIFRQGLDFIELVDIGTHNQVY